tara:strand:- start:530 stop:781 length:252 start_codon:yes stop_codon:yes gene_type:complete
MVYNWTNEKTGQPANKQKMVAGELVDLTAEEISLIETEREAAINQQVIDTETEAQKATDKASAKAKLIAGEALTEAEADTIVI